MAINPLATAPGGYLGGVLRPGTDATRGGSIHTEQTPARATETAAQPTRPGSVSIAQPTQRTLAANAPTGTDPELWSVLTAEERTFFAKVGSMGPLTYGRMSSNAPSAPPSIRGGRLDVKI